MNPDVKALWLAALRSGKYEQGQNVLRNEKNQYCCLGVLCELAVKAGVIPPAVRAFDTYTYDDAEVVLPPVVSRWAGFGTEAKDPDVQVVNPCIVRDGMTEALAELNDAREYGTTSIEDEGRIVNDFNTIASLIEEYL